MPRPYSALVCAIALATSPAGISAETPPSWERQVATTADGMPVLGSQTAPVRLVEFISYTCPHCASFSTEADWALGEGLVKEGKVAVEVRPFIRNGIDLVATLLATCGDKSRFFDNHKAILAGQASWLTEPSDPGYKARWDNPDFAARAKAVAQDLGLYRLMEARGYQAAELDLCLADEARGLGFLTTTDRDSVELGIQGTPSFLINGKLQSVHSWPELQAALQAALAAKS
jgi:protein-disulfide isomerase